MTNNIGHTTEIDVAVIGAGLAGLTAAMSAAKAGASVALIDARPLGGRARSAQRDGFTLNEGGHALFKAAGRSTLESLGVVVRGGDPDPTIYNLVWNGDIVPMPGSAAGLLKSRLFGTRQKAKLGRILASRQRTLPSNDITTDEFLAGRGVDDNLRKYLIATMRLSSYSANPGDQPAGAMVRQLVAGLNGVTYLDGGWQGLIDQLQSLATRSGVSVVEQTPIRSAERSGGDWVLHSDDSTWRAGSVVLAAGGPGQAERILGDDSAGWVAQAGEPIRAACLDIGGPAGGEPLLLSADEPLYSSIHAPLASLAPNGEHLYSLMRYLDSDADRSAERNRAELERFAVAAGVPAAGDRTLERFLAAPVVTWGRPVVGTPRPTGLERASEGVFAAGDWIGEHLLADASIASGATAGASAAQHTIAKR